MTEATTTISRPRRFFGWRIALFATITAALTAPGQTIGVSVFVDPMIIAVGLTRSEVSLAYLIGTLAGALALLPISRRIDRVGTRRAMMVIGLAFGGGLVAMSGVQGFLTLALGFILIRWLGQGSLGLVSTLAITPWFERRRGLVFGISMTAASIVMAFAPIILGLTIEAYGWRETWILSAVAVWLVVLPIARFGIIDRPSDVGQLPDGDAATTDGGPPSPERRSSSRRQALAQPRFWVVNAVIFASSGLYTALTFHQISILGAEGLTPTEAAALFVPQVIGAIVAGVVVGALADRIRARYLLALGMLFLTSALLMVSAIESGWQVVLYAIVLGAAAGTWGPLVATVLPRWYGLAHIGSVQGVASFVSITASAVGPITLAVVNEATGSYAQSALLFMTIPVAVGVAALFVTEPAPDSTEVAAA